MSQKTVAIVGAGLAGLTAALAARRLGLDVTLYEQAPDFAQIGGGIMIHSNGMRVLEALGLLESFAPHMRLTSHLQVEGPFGKVMSPANLSTLSIPYNRAAVVMRYELQEHLLAAAERAGVQTRFEHRLTELSVEKGRAILRFASGTVTEHDLVIAGDGLNSASRQSVGLSAARMTVGEAYLRGIAERPAPDDTVREIWGRDGRRFGICPLPGQRTYFFCSVPLGDWEDIRLGRLDEWIESWANFGPHVPALLKEVADWSRVNYSELYEIRLERWYSPPVFIIGDAAHAMTPNLGQGANSAMVDALVLMRMLADARKSGASLDDVGRSYDALRRPFVTRLQKTARQIGQLAGLTSLAGRGLRKAVFFLGNHVRPLQRRGLLLMAGYNPEEEGYLSARLEA